MMVAFSPTEGVSKNVINHTLSLFLLPNKEWCSQARFLFLLPDA